MDWDGKYEMLVIDPGTRKNLGWAIFGSSAYVTSLIDAGVDSMENLLVPGPYPFRIGSSARVTLIEAPRWYPRKASVDVNDLLDLSVAVGELKRHFVERGSSVQLVWPMTWKGSVPKKIHNRRVLAALTEEERGKLPKRPRAKDYDHNMVDAVGLGLWKLGRM